MRFFERFGHKPVNPPEGSSQERTPNKEWERAFRDYQKYFSLTPEELRQPLLDMGSHDGAYVQYLRNVLRNHEAYGLEKQENNIPPGQEGMVVGDGLSLPFADATFQTVTAKNYLPMFVADADQMRQAIIEPLRVLKPGGRLLGNIATPAKEQQMAKRWKPRGSPEARENARRFFDARYEGAEKLEAFLQNLENEGYHVTQRDSGNILNKEPIISIQKL